MVDNNLDSYITVPLIDQFMRPYQEEVKELGDGGDEVTLVLARLSKVIGDAGEPLCSNDKSNGARARTQSMSP